MSENSPPLIYIAGPYTAPSLAEAADNIHRAMMLGVEVAKLGGMPVTPHANTPLPFLDLQTPEFWYRGTKALLLASDMVALRVGWAASRGSRDECTAAREAAMPTFYEDDEYWRDKLAAAIAEWKKDNA